MKLPSQSPAPSEGFSRTHHELFDGEDFSVTHTASPQAICAIEDGRPEDVQQIVFANGAFTGRAVLGPLVDGMINLARGSGHKVEITTYDDPLTGSHAFGQSYRAERFDHVLRHVRERHKLDTDHPISLAGQSRGWLTLTQVAEATHTSQRFGSLTGLAPIGHTPRDIEVHPKDVLHILGLTWGEVTDKRSHQSDRHALIVKAGIARNVIAHTLGNGFSSASRNPWDIIRQSTLPFLHESQEILAADVTDRVVALSQSIGNVSLAAGRFDRYAPGEAIVQRFQKIPDFRGRVELYDTPHNGMLMDSKLVPDIYDCITNQPIAQIK